MSRNIVSNPILNSPFDPPSRHWEFGPTARIVDGRRSASYYGATRTDRGEVGAVASREETIALGLVNRVRERVNAWRAAGYPGVTHVTRDLLHHWNGPLDRPLFFCQREAVETIIWLTETSVAERQGIEVPPDVPQGDGLGTLRRYCAKMATGSGKTVVMAMVAAWSILNKLTSRQDRRFSEAVLVIGPNLTVKERLAVLVPQSPGNYYERFDLVPRGYLGTLSRGRVLVTNWHVFGVRDDSGKRQIVQRGKESPAAFANRILRKDLGDAHNLLVMNDEAHHAWRPAPVTEEELAKQLEGLSAEERKEALAEAAEATIWVEGLDILNKARGIRLVVDLSATPFCIRGSGYPEGSPLPWIVCDFGLVDAIESGITKIPRIPVSDDTTSGILV